MVTYLSWSRGEKEKEENHFATGTRLTKAIECDIRQPFCTKSGYSRGVTCQCRHRCLGLTPGDAEDQCRADCRTLRHASTPTNTYHAPKLEQTLTTTSNPRSCRDSSASGMSVNLVTKLNATSRREKLVRFHTCNGWILKQLLPHSSEYVADLARMHLVALPRCTMKLRMKIVR